MLLGAHVSSAGGIYRAVGRATSSAADSLQVFPQSPRVWKPAVHSDEDLARFRELAAEAGLVAVSHAPYLINLAGTDPLDRRALGRRCSRNPCARRAASAAWP